MTSRLSRLAWALTQLCFLPIAPARIVYDSLCYLTARYVCGKHIESIDSWRRGYRLGIDVEWKPEAPLSAKRACLSLPLLFGLAALAPLYPFLLVLFNGTPTDLVIWKRVAIEIVAVQAVALPWPRARDLPAWRAFLGSPDTTNGGVES